MVFLQPAQSTPSTHVYGVYMYPVQTITFTNQDISADGPYPFQYQEK